MCHDHTVDSSAVLRADALFVALMRVDERSDRVPRDLRRVLQLATGLQRQHGLLVARLQAIQQHEGVHAVRRRLLRVRQQRAELVHARAVRVERLVLFLPQRSPLRQQLADAVGLRRLELLLEPVPEAVGEVQRHLAALGRLRAQVVREGGPQRSVCLGGLIHQLAVVLRVVISRCVRDFAFSSP